MSRKARLSGRINFNDWETVLTRSEIPAHRKESMTITIRWYLSWAKRARVPVDFDSARDFIARVELEKRPVPYRLEQWKEALRWFFGEGWKQEGEEEGSAKIGGPAKAGTPYAARSAEGAVPQDQIGRVSSSAPDQPAKLSAQPQTLNSDLTGWEQMIRLFRVRKYSYRTEQSYVEWMGRFAGVVSGQDPRFNIPHRTLRPLREI